MISKIDAALFNETINTKKTNLHFLKNGNGAEIAITNYGARVVALVVPDTNQKPTDVVIGFDSLKGYLNSTETYYSAIIGRYANRIARGKFSLNARPDDPVGRGKTYQLSINNPPNHLHGGPLGFHVQVWDVKEFSENSIKLSYFSKEGEENYPGNVTAQIQYTLTGNNELILNYEATTDAPTVLNLTAHPFFNLNGQGNGTVEHHLLQIHADNYNPVDDSLIPTGIFPVTGTPFDFRNEKKIGQNIYDDDQQLKYGAGYDHNFVLNGNGLRTVAKATGDKSGITMEVVTDQPGMQLYSGNYLKSENKIKYGFVDQFREAFCLETQHFPDSPNQPDFPTTVLNPGEVFQSTTIYKFSIS